MTIGARNMPQDVTHWSVTGSTGYGGFTFGTPVKIKGRWEDRNDIFTDNAGEQHVSNAIVFLNADAVLGDYLAEGDLVATADPTTLAGAHRIRQYQKITDLRNVQVVRKAIL